MSLGTTISRLRTAQNLSQGDLAEALGVSRQSISKWETDGSVPELEKLVKLARLFGVTLDELVLEGSPAPETPARESPAPPSPDRGLSGRKIAAIVLLSMGALVTLVLTILGSLLSGLILASPFFLCGAVCLLCRRRAGLWCGWTVFLLADLYLRFATGINWRLTLLTLSFTPEQNYTRLLVAWCQLLGTLALPALTVFRFRKAPLRLSRRGRIRLLTGWLAFLVFSLSISLWFRGRSFAYLLVLADDLRLALSTTLLVPTVWGLLRRTD